MLFLRVGLLLCLLWEQGGCHFQLRSPKHETRVTSAQHMPSVSSGLPSSFDGRKVWPNCIHSVLDQGDCGSCWAFASTEALSDRFCIFTNGTIDVVLSPQNLLSCEEENLGCALGSLPNFAWHYFQETGVTTMDCVPYTADEGHVDKCTHTCKNASVPYALYTVNSYEHVGSSFEPATPAHITAIQRALMDGPVDATFNVYADFEYYTGGVYNKTTDAYKGLHSVKVIGWGEEGDASGKPVPYWLVQNSWGIHWGIEGGFFKILRGVDECGFESLMYTGVPHVQHFRL